MKLPEGLKSVNFGPNFNKEIKLFQGLKTVIFYYNHYFSKKIKLSKELKVITVCKKFKLNLLPNNLEEICFNCNHGVNKNINYITNKIKKVCILSSKKILKNLPNSIKFINFDILIDSDVLNKYYSRTEVSGY